VETDPEHSVPNLTSGREEATSQERKAERSKVKRSRGANVKRSKGANLKRSKMDETINYRNRKEDGEWSEKFLKLSVREAFNSAHEILATRAPESHMLKDVIKSEIRKGGKEGTLIWRSASTEKYKYLLADFLKCALFGMRTVFDEDVCANVTFANAADFLKTFLNVVSNPINYDDPVPEFVEKQTLEQVIEETVNRLVEKHPCGCDEAENRIEREEFGLLAKQFARNTTVLLLSFDLALDLDCSVNLFRHTLSLLSSMVDAKKSEYNIQA